MRRGGHNSRVKKSAAVFDTLFTFAAAFLAALFLGDYFLRDMRVFPFAATAALFAAFFVRRGHRAKKRKTVNLEELANKFVFSPKPYALSFTKAALSNRGDPQEEDGVLTLAGTAFYPCFLPEPLTPAHIAEGYGRAAKSGAERLVFLTANGAAQSAAVLAARLQSPQTEIWDFARVYAFFRYLKAPPKETLALKSNKTRFTLKSTVARPKALKYAFTALVLLFFARFAPFAPLYAVTAAFCFTLALLCLILSRPQKARRKKRS